MVELVRIRDELTDAEADIAARVVVNAAGVWAAHVQHLAGAMRTVPDPAQRCAEPTAHTLRMRTQFTAWFSPLRRIAVARPRVGLMFSSRFGPLMVSQKVPAVLSASASDISA